MAKRINYSPYEKQVLLVCVKEYANIIEDKRTDRTEERQMKMTGRRSQISTRVLMSQRGPAKCWKLAGKNLRKKQQHKTRDTDSKKSKDFLLNPYLYLQCVC